jgi:PKHD-type hydroxylase
MTHKLPSNLNSFYAFEKDKVSKWAYWEKGFTPDECKKIIAYGESLNKEKATTFNTNPVNPDIRDSYVSWINPSLEINWMYEKLSAYIQSLNNDYFKFDLVGFTESIQFTQYIAPSGHYVPHVDNGADMYPRKLSAVVQLSDSKDYEGGNLELFYRPDPVIMPKDQGFLAVFPSYTLHGVTPVTRGVRHSLVMWLGGPSFK